MKQRAMFSILAATAVVVAVVAWESPSAVASSHREAPAILSTPKVDGTDFYMFRSYEPGRQDFITVVANYLPLQDPYGGPNYFSLDQDARYDIHINNNGGDNPDGQITEDLTFRFQFFEDLNPIRLNVGGTAVAVPLVNVGPFGSPFGTDLLSQIRTYRLQLIRGNIDDPTSINPVTRVGTGATRFDMPFDNIGSNSIPDGYAAYANQFTHDIGIPGCDDGKVFVGQRKEPFVVNLGEVFDLINLNPVGNPDAEASDTKDKNITSLILEVPTDCLTEGGSGIIGGWTTARLPRNRTLSDDPTFEQPDQQLGDFVQVSRLANPLVNEVAIGLPDKNLFNAAHPRDDGANFLQYVTNPTLPALIETLFGVPAPTNIPRNDLVKFFLTGFSGLNEDGSVGEVMRLNTNIPPTPVDDQNRLGVTGGDLAAFPNGRRPGDDVVDITERVVMGVLCYTPDPNAPPAGDEFFATLTGPNVVPPVPSTQGGTCLGALNGNNFGATCNHNIQNVIRGSFRMGAAGEEGPEICRDATGPVPVVFADCFLSTDELQALLNDGTYIELSTINNPDGAARGQVNAPMTPSLGMCDPDDAVAGSLPLNDGAYQGPDQFDDVFPYLGDPLPGSPNDETTREANLIGENLDPPAETDQRGFASLTLVQGTDFSFAFRFRTNLTPPYTANVLDGGPDGTVVWAVDVEDTGDQEATLDANNSVGGDPLIFADGFESGDVSAWSSVTSGKAKGAAATPIIAGPFR